MQLLRIRVTGTLTTRNERCHSFTVTCFNVVFWDKTFYDYKFVQMIITILPSKPPVEPSFHDGVTVVLGRPMVKKFFTCSPDLSVLIRNVLLLHFIGSSQMNILQAFNLPRKKNKKIH